MNKIETVESAPASSGRTQLLKYLSKERLTQRQAIVAKCCDCMGYYVDGRIDCRMPDCTLYPWMPYKGAKTEPNKTQESPKYEALPPRKGGSERIKPRRTGEGGDPRDISPRKACGTSRRPHPQTAAFEREPAGNGSREAGEYEAGFTDGHSTFGKFAGSVSTRGGPTSQRR